MCGVRVFCRCTYTYINYARLLVMITTNTRLIHVSSNYHAVHDTRLQYILFSSLTSLYILGSVSSLVYFLLRDTISVETSSV